MNKGQKIQELISSFNSGTDKEGIYLANPNEFEKLPNSVIGYDMPASYLKIFNDCGKITDRYGQAYQGHAIKTDVFYRP